MTREDANRLRTIGRALDMRFNSMFDKVLYWLVDTMSNHDNRSDPPFLFRKNSLKYWILIASVVYVSIGVMQSEQWDIQSMDSKDDAESASIRDILYINAGILATMLAVTLGVTLIGLQLRTQSYTRGDLIDYVNDKVVFGFIILFIGNATLSMAVAMWGPPLGMQRIIASYVITGTFFSLCYHAAYIYHVVYKLQSSEILKDIYEKMKCVNHKSVIDTSIEISKPYTKRILISEDEGYDVDDRSFEIWKDLMKKTVDGYNAVEFKMSVENMLNLKKDTWYQIVAMEHLLEVVGYCIEKNRRRLEAEFVDIVEGRYLHVENIHGDHMDIKVLELLNRIIRTAIDNDDHDLFAKSLRTTLTIIQTRSDNWHQQHEDAVTILTSKNMYDAIHSCTKQNRYKMQRLFIYCIEHKDLLLMDYDDSETTVAWRETRVEDLSNIGRKAVLDDNSDIFVRSTIALMNIFRSSLKEWREHDMERVIKYSSAHMTVIMQLCVKHDRYQMISHFIGEVERIITTTDDRMEARIARPLSDLVTYTMKFAMLKAANNDDESTFLNGIRSMISMLNSSLKNSDNDERIDIIISHISDIMRSCTRQNRHQLERIFINEALGNYKQLLTHDDPRIKRWKSGVLNCLYAMAGQSVENGYEDSFLIYMNGINDLLHDILEKCPEEEKNRIIDIGNKYIMEIMKKCMDQDRRQFQDIFMSMIVDHDLLMRKYDDRLMQIWRNDVLDILGQMVLNATINDEKNIFRKGLETMAAIIDKILTDCPGGYDPQPALIGATHIPEVINSCIDQNRYILQTTFMGLVLKKDFLLANHDDGLSGYWRDIALEAVIRMLIKSIDNNNEMVFEAGLSAAAMLLEEGMKEDSKNLRGHMTNFVVVDLSEVMMHNVEHDHRLKKAFPGMIIRNNLLLVDNLEIEIRNWRRIVISSLVKIMLKAINDDDRVIFFYCINEMRGIIDAIMDKITNDERDMIVKYISAETGKGIKVAIAQNHEYVLSEFIRYTMEHDIMITEQKHVKMAKNWEKIIWDSLVLVIQKHRSSNSKDLFKESINAIFHIYEEVFKKRGGEEYTKHFFIEYIDKVIQDCLDSDRSDFADYVIDKKNKLE